MAGTKVGEAVNRILFVAVPRLVPTKLAVASAANAKLAKVNTLVAAPLALVVNTPPAREKVKIPKVSAELLALPA